MNRPNFRERVHQAREEAIIAAALRLLAEKGFEQMTLDEVAADVGVAKASLYKHFASKEALAAAAMVRTMDLALEQVAAARADASTSPLDRLKALTQWALRTQLAGAMPTLPAQNSNLRAALLADRRYLDRLMMLSDQLGAWIVAAQTDGSLNSRLPAEALLYELFARACDPVPGFLKAGGAYSDEQIIEWVMSTCFDGLASRPARAQ